MSVQPAQNPKLNIICEDGPVIAVNKPSGVISQGAPAGLQSLAEQVKAYLKVKYNKPGVVYLGIPHRLDRPVSGVSVFARNSKSAARLSDQFAKRQVTKTYRAILEKPPTKDEGVLEDWIYRIPDHSRVEISNASTKGAKHARLTYRTLAVSQGKALVEVDLETGRMHQIRIQFASRGYHILGDEKYGANSKLRNPIAIGLHAWQLSLIHPIRKEPLTITAPQPEEWGRLGFGF
ncbi:RNA pseudouridine synthase [Planctomicrobium sp.]|nr:RNA pseudouridine synthase [Planctomicrobium sp.]MDA7527887.1 RNA pseudouridine synthase [bacterium]MBT5018936.1 RNA pseudouridine synthase [Planctomicrobium sp.]MDB4731844.1 RNA pseudouridine synthase [bacterium]MDB4733695.1 RNA pseudouridine synthase [Planctomicrobium sp.]MDB4743505.1 RNA pseudouridine synthase [Planctomicrobium sp.]